MTETLSPARTSVWDIQILIETVDGAHPTAAARAAAFPAYGLPPPTSLGSVPLRENADEVGLWPKHGLPIQPRPDEDEVILGQVVMTDFSHAQVPDRLLVHERRIESSLYRTMAEMRKEQEVRKAAEASPSQGNLAVDRKVNKVNQVNEVNKVLTLHPKNALVVDREPGGTRASPDDVRGNHGLFCGSLPYEETVLASIPGAGCGIGVAWMPGGIAG